ncbi:C4-dicarboxylate-specific signal transduction histidine kinase [Pseudomonas sp. YL-218 TE3947]
MTPTLPRRPRWRSLALLALCLAPLLWPLEHLAERYYRSELAGQNRQTLDLYVANLLGTLHRYEVLPQILGELPALRATLAAPDEGVIQGNANRLLKNISAQTGAEVMYLMDTTGKTLAASNWGQTRQLRWPQFRFPSLFQRSHGRASGALLRPGHHLGQARLLLRGGDT